MVQIELGSEKAEPDFGMTAAICGLVRRGYIPKIVYDIGASDGSWSQLALHYWPDATCICFEPLMERHEALTALSTQHKNQIVIQKCGISDSDGELAIGITDHLWDSSFAYGGVSSRNVKVQRLDTLLENGVIPPPSFIKIDVQGFEKRVLEGGKKAIQSADLILMECNFFAFCEDMCTLDVMIAYMAEAGFIPYEFVDYMRRPLDGAMGQCDILFVRRDHPLVLNKRWS